MKTPIEFEIDFGDSTETLPVVPIGGSRYRLEASSVCADIYWHDIIEADCVSNKTLRFRGVHQRSGMKVESAIVAKDLAESPTLGALLERVIESAGTWERMFGGLVIVHLPEDSRLDFLRELSLLRAPRP